MQIGNLRVTVLSGGRMRLDGGAMFGPVPKALWQKVAPADEQNRIEMDTNLLLINAGGTCLLVDAGLGVDLTPKERALFGLEPPDAVASLAAVGVQAADIDVVVFTHLHWDHAAGATRKRGDRFVPTFPRARHFVQRQEYQDALDDYGTGKGGYQRQHFVPIMEAGQFELLDGDAEIVPGVRVRVTGGHTRAHQLVLLESEGQRGVYFADTMPTTHHLRPAWNMGYDLFPLDTVRVKLELAHRAADDNWICFWDHDPVVRVGRIVRDEGKLRVVE